MAESAIFRDVVGAEVSGAARACRRTSRKLGRPERHTAAGGLAVVRDAVGIQPDRKANGRYKKPDGDE
jgi:hypothetical protein